MLDQTQLPLEVQKAWLVEFGFPVTAYLMQPKIEASWLEGRVYLDSLGRFMNGRMIHTSTILEFTEHEGYLVASTFSGSLYVLVSKDGDILRDLRGES